MFLLVVDGCETSFCYRRYCLATSTRYIKMDGEDDQVNEVQKLKNLVDRQSRDTAALIEALARRRGAPGPGGPAHVPDAAEVAAARADKISKLDISLRKSYKVKEFKDVNESSVKEWLTKFEQEVTTLKKLNGIADDLT